MIEFSCIHNGGTDLPIARADEAGDITYAVGDLAAGHRAAQRTVAQQVEQAVLAEQLGFHYYFMTEHHFQPEGAEFSPSPIVVGAAIAMRTERIRIGQMANILARHHPIALAEQAAMLDVLSGGRLEFGVGRGGGPRETEVFGQVYGSSDLDPDRAQAYFDEALEIILKAWTEDSFSYHGDFYAIPPKWNRWESEITRAYFSQEGVAQDVSDIVEARGGKRYVRELSVYPHPLQQPHPQVWMTGLSANSAREAARRGFNLCHLGAGPDQVRQVLDTYHTEAEASGWPDRNSHGPLKFGWDSQAKRGVSFLRWIHIGDITPERRNGLFHFPNYVATSLIDGIHLPHGMRLTGSLFEQMGVTLHGSKERIIDGLMTDFQLGGFEDYHVFPVFEAAGMTGKEAEDQMHMFAEEVMPVLQAECGGSPQSPALIEPSLN
jgi:alkanesulfonate monooxygenase SsuD/methylene tetrahydromethanopterin reductase-like flavin-dependent oxidoreductase (luciferase family)